VLRKVDRAADLLRFSSVLGVGYALVLGGLDDLAVFAVVVVVVVVAVPRLAALPRPVDLAVVLTWSVAAWADASAGTAPVPG
jgi:hypothetical protein